MTSLQANLIAPKVLPMIELDQDDFWFVVPPLEGVGLGHRDQSKETRSLTVPPAAPFFATQPGYSAQAA
jgi:hypothetical protein